MVTKQQLQATNFAASLGRRQVGNHVIANNERYKESYNWQRSLDLLQLLFKFRLSNQTVCKRSLTN